jgi:transposase
MKDTQLFTLALGLEGTPWFVREITFDAEQRRLDLHLDFIPGTRFTHPISGQPAPVHDTVQKHWRHMNFFQFECYLQARVPRVQDPEHGVRLIPVPWARPDSGFSLLMEALMVLLGRTAMAVCEVARLVGEYAQRLWPVLHHYAESAHDRLDLSEVTTIGVDEVSFRSGQDYLTVVSTPKTDTQPARVVFVDEGHDAAILAVALDWLRRHGCQPPKLSHAVIDLSPAYHKGLREHLPGVEVVFDWFHVMKLAGEAVDLVRRRETQNVHGLLTGTRYLWLKRTENLTPGQAARRTKLLRSGLATVRAWLRLEALRTLAQEPDPQAAEAALKWWCTWTLRSRIPELKRLVGTIRGHWAGIVAYFRTRITNATAEALNGIIQTVKRKARGFRTLRCFRTMIYLVAGHLDLRLPRALPI